MADEEKVIVVPERAGIAEAEALHAHLRALPPGAPIRLEASAVQTLSTAFVLTVVSALNSRAEVTPPATVINPSAAFVDAFTDLGLFQDLMKMEFAS